MNMSYDDENARESTEQQLRRELAELKQQLRAQREGHAGPPEVHWRPSGMTITSLVLGIMVLFSLLFVAGYVPLQRRDATVRAEEAEHEKELPRMGVMHVGHGGSGNEVRLPGTMQAVTEAPIMARTDGYLKRRLVDIGDQVSAGQILAEIDAPELDHQAHQAESAIAQAQAAADQAQANLEQGKANRDLARINADRWKALVEKGLAPQQESDQYQAQIVALNANVQALEKAVAAQNSSVSGAKSNLARLLEVQGYRLVKAPFDGVITLRNIDVGALVSTGNTLLFRIAQTETLRTYVNVPQAGANAVRVGQAATITASNFPGRTFHGKVTRTASALDPSSRTLLVEVDVPNADRALLPGTYTEVTLAGARPDLPITVPASAVIFRTDGAQVAVVQPDFTLHLQKISVGRDYGDRLEVLQGVQAGTTIVTVPGDAARDGARIIPVEADSPQKD
jgi:RND family efflux transporter MFP subunit